MQCWINVEYVGPTLYKCYTNILCLLGPSSFQTRSQGNEKYELKSGFLVFLEYFKAPPPAPSLFVVIFVIPWCLLHTIETEGIKHLCFSRFSYVGQITDAASVNHIFKKLVALEMNRALGHLCAHIG